MAQHDPAGPPWNRLTYEQLNGAQFALRYLRTSVLVRGQALSLVDDLTNEIREEMIKKSPKCDKNNCTQECRKTCVPMENPLEGEKIDNTR